MLEIVVYIILQFLIDLLDDFDLHRHAHLLTTCFGILLREISKDLVLY